MLCCAVLCLCEREEELPRYPCLIGARNPPPSARRERYLGCRYFYLITSSCPSPAWILYIPSTTFYFSSLSVLILYWRDTLHDKAGKENASGQHSQPYLLQPEGYNPSTGVPDRIDAGPFTRLHTNAFLVYLRTQPIRDIPFCSFSVLRRKRTHSPSRHLPKPVSLSLRTVDKAARLPATAPLSNPHYTASRDGATPTCQTSKAVR